MLGDSVQNTELDVMEKYEDRAHEISEVLRSEGKVSLAAGTEDQCAHVATRFALQSVPVHISVVAFDEKAFLRPLDPVIPNNRILKQLITVETSLPENSTFERLALDGRTAHSLSSELVLLCRSLLKSGTAWADCISLLRKSTAQPTLSPLFQRLEL